MDCRAFLRFAVLALLPAHAIAQCRLCSVTPTAIVAEAERPLTIEVETALDFSRATGNDGGSIAVDGQTGARQVSGLVDLGGIALKGSAVVTGTPGRHVRITLPSSVRLLAPDGSSADAVDLRTDLLPDPTLGADGTLKFTFGGRLLVRPGTSGDLRGRIAIVADYQ